MTKGAEGVGGTSQIFPTPKWNMSGKATTWMGRIAIALAIIAAVGVVLTFLVHGGVAGFGGDALMFGGGGGALLLGGAWVFSKVRSAIQERKLRKLWESEDNKEQIKELAEEKQGTKFTKYTTVARLGGKEYSIEVDNTNRTAVGVKKPEVKK